MPTEVLLRQVTSRLFTSDEMRLINVQSLGLEVFYGAEQDIPRYAILSHTWGADELTLAQFTNGDLQVHSHKDGYAKIARCCHLAAAAGLGYAWVHTVCIDKSSSAELTEAINSMFRWYQNAAVCHVWLNDLLPDTGDLSRLEDCRWFRRGWTLQELLAPAVVEFYDRDWAFRGTKQDLQRKLCDITNISEAVLEKPGRMFGLSVAQRMSWAASRETTRPEDLAYCLLGIFYVNMPLLYGEGERAFLRLQDEISKETNDLSLFAWRHPDNEQGAVKQPFHGVFAPSPDRFIGGSHILTGWNPALGPEYMLTNKGIRVEANLTELEDGRVLLLLNVLSWPARAVVGIWVRAHGGGVYSRVESDRFGNAPQGGRASAAVRKRIYLLKRISPAYAQRLLTGHHNAIFLRQGFHRLSMPRLSEFSCEITRVHPEDDWVAAQRAIYTHGASEFTVFVWFELRVAGVPCASDGLPTAVLVVCKLEENKKSFALLLSSDLADKVLQPSGQFEKSLLSSFQGTRDSIIVMGPGIMRLSVSLEWRLVNEERVYCVDMAFHKW